MTIDKFKSNVKGQMSNVREAMIKIYSTKTCVYCKMAKEFFDKHSIQYENHDVGEDPKAREEMINKSQQMGVPVIDIDGQIIVGFDQRKIEELLNIK